ncbi:overexpressed in colon carcinoma 1 protein homolog [Ictalurus punctatus]|uniref:Overexpressed in colon carcinoma 1 protein homolog n=1 Tax=Ictalurus punctatus TaxID=7998 RepID=A0A2D0T2S1_ICTPU|nr:overexpressed in colon carcinoma 1 protein homolog [Ictalurus punctatus]
MGCGNSSVASTAGGQPEAAKGETEDASPDDEKRKNYGGVYVGLPADLSNFFFYNRLMMILSLAHLQDSLIMTCDVS